MPALFLSFATEDTAFVVQLFSRLKRLGMQVWDYSHRDEEIAAGEFITDALKARVKACDYFIPILSSNSALVSKHCICWEVECAISMQKLCIPVLISANPPVEWPGPFQNLRDRKYVAINQEEEQLFEEKISELCSYLQVLYQPDISDAHRLPLFKRLQQELIENIPGIEQLQQKRYLHEKLLTEVNRFNRAYMAGEWLGAFDTISFILQFSARELNRPVLYYALVVKAVCELQLNRLDDAAKTAAVALQHSAADHNARGALAQVYYRQQRLEAALDEFQQALQKCAEGETAEIIYNILIIAMEVVDTPGLPDELFVRANEILDNSAYKNILKSRKYKVVVEAVRVKLLLARVYGKQEAYTEAFRLFERCLQQPVGKVSAAAFGDAWHSKTVTVSLQLALGRQGIVVPAGIPVTQVPLMSVAGSTDVCVVITCQSAVYLLVAKNNVIKVYYREPVVTACYAQLLAVAGDAVSARQLLVAEAAGCNSRFLYHHYARLLLTQGNAVGARQIYYQYLCGPPYNRQWLAEYALILRMTSETAEWQQYCEIVVNTGWPQEANDCYYQGLAYFLLGKKEIAGMFYEKSGALEVPYQQLL